MNFLEIIIAILIFAVSLIILAAAFNEGFPMEDIDEENDDSKAFW